MAGVPPKDVPKSEPKEELKSPLEEYCAEKLQEFDDLDEGARRAAAESIRLACESSDDESCLVHILSPDILTSPEEHTTPEAGGAVGGGLSDADAQGAVGSTLQFLNTDLIATPAEEHPRRFKAFLDRFKKSGETSRSERFKLFMMLTTAKEYVKRKWRMVTKKKVEGDSESTVTSCYTSTSGGHTTDDEYSRTTTSDENLNAKGGDENSKAKDADKNLKAKDGAENSKSKGGDEKSNSKGADKKSDDEKDWC